MQTVERWITRSDAWTPEDDDRLSALVLQHIRTGSTQLRAFEEAANELGRTAAACGYRWNGVVRKGYRDDIEVAKRDRKSAQKMSHADSMAKGLEIATPMNSSESMKDVVKFLQTFDDQYQKLRLQIDSLESERRRLQEKVNYLETELTKMPEVNQAVTPEQLEEDSKTLFAIMERARRLLETDSARARIDG